MDKFEREAAKIRVFKRLADIKDRLEGYGFNPVVKESLRDVKGIKKDLRELLK